jgi:hypothetical protein
LYANALYYEACHLASTGQTQEAMRNLREAVQRGFHYVQSANEDEELDSLRALAEFNELVTQMETNLALRQTAGQPSSNTGIFDAASENQVNLFSWPGRIALVTAAVAACLALISIMYRRRKASQIHPPPPLPGKTKPSRWRFRFSVRTLTIAVTLICVYLSCWGLTKRYGLQPAEKDRLDFRTDDHGMVYTRVSKVVDSSPLPFVIHRSTFGGEKHRYFLWFFGIEWLMLER